MAPSAKPRAASSGLDPNAIDKGHMRLLLAARSFVFRLSAKGKQELLIPPADQLFGLPIDEVRRRHFAELLIPQDRERATVAFQTALSGSRVQVQLGVMTPRGRVRHVDFTLIPSGEGGVDGLGNDVTGAVEASEQRRSHRQALMALATSSEFMQGAPEKAFKLLTRLSALTLKVARASVWELADDGQRLNCLALFEVLTSRFGKAGEIHARNFPDYFRALSSDRCVAARIAQEDPRTRELAESYLIPLGVVSMLDAPIQQGGRVIGVVCFEHRGEPRAWTPDEENFAASLGDLVCLAMERRSRRSAERALAKAQEDYGSLVSSVRAIVWRGEARTLRTLFVGGDAEGLLGFEPQRWTHEPGFLIARLHPDDRAATVEIARTAAREGRDFDFEARAITASERVLWLRASFRLVGRRGVRQQAVGLLQDVTARREAEELSRKREALLRDFSGHVEWAREEERTRISRVIHDELGQTLTAMRLDAFALRRVIDAKGAFDHAEAAGRTDSIVSLVDATLNRARRLARDLRPSILDDLGLVAAVEWQIAQFKQTTEMACLLEVDASLQVPRDVATMLFRIVQESLTNVTRHSAARTVKISLTMHDRIIELMIKDDGRGFAKKRRHGSFGLLGMEERARRVGGTCLVSSRAGRGVTVRVTVPISAETPAA